MRWSYGVTTVPARRDDLLPRTLASLKAGGFGEPRLFVDGATDDNDWARIPLEKTFRYPAVRTFGNWWLSLVELYVREPVADRFALFQDDIVVVRNLRAYLEGVPYPEQGYLNLYTFPANQALCLPGVRGFYPSDQLGKGAVALVFDRRALLDLLASYHFTGRPLDAIRGWRAVDGGVVTALAKVNPPVKEYVHNPSLVQHVGMVSSMGNRQHPEAPSFPGEGFDAMSLLS